MSAADHVPAWRWAAVRLVLVWEMLWPAAIPPLAWAGLFVAVTLFGLWTVLPGFAHLAGLAVFAAVVGHAAWRGVRRCSMPKTDAVRRRLELASGLSHRPLTALDDKLAINIHDPVTLALWQTHRRRMAAAARRLRVGLPSPGMAARDPMALRFGVVLLLLVGIALAGERAGERLAAAFQPRLEGVIAAEPWHLALWLTPPDYTGEAPVWLDATVAPGPDPIRVPEGSVLLGQFEGGTTQPRVAIGTTEEAFIAAGTGRYQIETRIGSGDRIAILRGEQELVSWPIVVVPDEPPTAAFAQPPNQTYRGAVELAYAAVDDYGLADLKAEIRRPEEPDALLAVTVPLPRPGATEAKGTSFHDLTAHPWAGVNVTMQLVAIDASGQEGRSVTVPYTLPERVFVHPIARIVIEQRRRLSVDPGSRREVAELLRALTTQPEEYLDAAAVTLGLSVAGARLVLDRSETAIPSVQELLWYTALAIEDGPLALAEQAMRDLQQRIMEAMARGADDMEIEQLLDQLEQSLGEFLNELVKQAESEAGGELGEDDPLNQAINSGELAQMIEEARELLRSGSREAARAMLARLQEILENLKTGRVAGLNQGLSNEASAMLQNLRQIMKGQRELLDETYSGLRQGDEIDPDRMNIGRATQESLMRGLQQLMQHLGDGGYDIPKAFNRADRAMGRALRALEQAMPSQAVGPQTDAMDQLQQGAQSLIESFTQQLSEGTGRDNIGFFSAPRDPMGRAVQGQGLEDAGDVQIPDKASLHQIQEILEELYRRASDRRRPTVEHDYLKRLLRRF
ncbi:MAG: TIGR02302 family protein [Alphaproteobacteria bacterium]|nr:TIGR02302 family protein [Alphaproteobacteria bacterium]